jgi:two-component system chemotaxis response regulator CheY
MKPIQVMVVEDEAALRDATVDLIRRLGYACRGAVDGLDALRQQDAEPADIVLTDWRMPGMDGIALCRALKERTPAPYVIMTTALDEPSRLIDAIREGADEFLRKPIAPDELEVRLMAGVRLVRANTELAERNRQLRHESEREFRAARTDPLTSVANRLMLDEDLARIVANASRYGHRYSAAFVDVDVFKQYNDRYGHLAGDQVLQQVASAIVAQLRASDRVYRYGGDELLVLLPEQTEEQAIRAMERVRAAVQEVAMSHEGSPFGVVTVSVGVAELGSSTREDWLSRADRALYRAKASGRNAVRPIEASAPPTA